MDLVNESRRILSNNRNSFLPEKLCEISFQQSLDVGKEIHVYPLRWDNEAGFLTVLCQDQLFFIKKEELSIYPLTYFSHSNIPKEVSKIFKNRILSVKICENEFGEKYLSRRQNMLDAIDYFSQHVKEIFNVQLYPSSIPELAFCEIGAGIVGVIEAKQCTHSHISDACEYLSEKAKWGIIPAKIMNFCGNRFYLSYKRALPYPVFREGEIVSGRVMNYVSAEDHSGVFVELHPMLSGILDTAGIKVFLREEEALDCDNCPYIVFGQLYHFRLFRKRSPGFSLELI